MSRKLLWLVVIVLSIERDRVNANAPLTHFDNVRATASASEQEHAARGVLHRLLQPNNANRMEAFKLVVDFRMTQNSFRIRSSSDKITITGSSGVATLKGLSHYLKYYCGCHISWDGYQLQLPDTLPHVNYTLVAPSQFIYYQNVCTWSYSYAWWSWNRWRQHIDWMALQGITITLAPVQEYVWAGVYKQLGLTDTEISEHIAGPGFLAWQRMGNIRGWGGPLSTRYMLFSSNLQKLVVAEQRQLGMVVALPALAGHVPSALKRLYPNASLTPVDRWNHFPDHYAATLFLDPIDPLFRTIANIFLRAMTTTYGTDHIYFADPFNEIQPHTLTNDYLASVSASIFNGMKEVDSGAIWLLQGWMFVKNPIWADHLIEAFLQAVPIGRLLVLDLQSEQYPQYERTKSFYGHPFIWCMLHNFGGTLGMHGSMDIVNSRISQTWNMVNSTMIGVGITPEGIHQNYVMYEFALEAAWRNTSLDDVGLWLDQYATSRYGMYSGSANTAWHSLWKSVYSYTGLLKIRGKYAICRRPSLRIHPWSWYNVSSIHLAVDSLLKCNSTMQNSSLYQYDLVDVTRQLLQIRGDQIYVAIIKAYRQRSVENLTVQSRIFVQLLADMEILLRSNENFLLGRWLESAKEQAHTDTEEQLFEFNARNQITLWGPNGQIVDYATKQWSGLFADLFLPRWQLFFDELITSATTNVTFNEKRVQLLLMNNIEKPFCLAHKSYPDNSDGNTIEIVRTLYQRWGPNFNLIPLEPLRLPTDKRTQLAGLRKRTRILRK